MIKKILFLVLLSAFAAAYMVPCPVTVKLSSGGYNVPVKMTNLYTTESVQITTNRYGEAIYDWGNSVQGWRSGDQVKVEAMGKSTTITLPYDGIVGFEVDCPPECTIVCPDPDCPDPGYAACDSCCEECPDPECPEESNIEEIVLAFLAIVGAGAGGYMFYRDKMGITRLKSANLIRLCPAGCGMKMYKSRDGRTIKILHRHYGIKGYHNPDTVHRDPAERHEQGDIFPLGIKKESERSG